MDNLEAKVIEHGEQIKTLFENQKRIEKVVDKIEQLTLSIEKMAVIQTDLIEEQKDIKKDIKGIKEEPANDAKYLKREIIKTIVVGVVSAIVGALLALVIKGGL